jgi:hypothetical protein
LQELIVPGSRERAKLNRLPSRWARLKRNVEYAARRVCPNGTARRIAWLYGYDVMAEEHDRLLEAACGPVGGALALQLRF